MSSFNIDYRHVIEIEKLCFICIKNIVHTFRKIFHLAKSLLITFSHFHEYIRRALRRDFLPPSRAILIKGEFNCVYLVEKSK